MQVIFQTREEADAVLEKMGEILDRYSAVYVQDLNDLIGFSSRYTDGRLGWDSLEDISVQEHEEGYSIDFPDASPL